MGYSLACIDIWTFGRKSTLLCCRAISEALRRTHLRHAIEVAQMPAVPTLIVLKIGEEMVVSP